MIDLGAAVLIEDVCVRLGLWIRGEETGIGPRGGWLRFKGILQKKGMLFLYTHDNESLLALCVSVGTKLQADP